MSPFAVVPTALMRQGNFSEISTPIRNPLTGQPFAGNIIPPSMLSPVSLNLLQYYPAPTAPGTANNYQATSANTDNVDQTLVRVDQNIGNKVRLYVRHNWHDSFNSNVFNSAIPVTEVTQPRVNKNSLFTYTHTLRPNLVNDFRIGYHRIDFDTLNYFAVNGIESAGADLGIPGFDGDVKYKNPGLPSINVSNFATLGVSGSNWYQFDTTFQASNVMAYMRGSHNVRGGFDLRRLATGRRAANDPRGLFSIQRRHQRVSDGGLHAGDAADRHSANRSDPGSRRRLAKRVLRQRRVAGGQEPDSQSWSPVRDEYPRPDLRGAGHHAGRRLRDDHPGHAAVEGLSSSRNRITATLPHASAPPTASERRQSFAPGFGIYYNPNQMNSFTFLTNNPPLAAVTTFTSDPANPTLSFANPSGPVGPAGTSGCHLADPETAERTEGPVEPRHPA